jgi:orotate phosphoribosyltransferase
LLDRRATAALLLDARAVMLNLESPFRYASGILSPIYCDNRILISDPDRRSLIVDGLTTLVSDLAPTANLVAGTATAGIPWAAWIADRRRLPMVYVRAAAKEHGRGQRIEGRLPDPAVAVVVEDLVTSGGSSLSTVEALREAGAEVVGIVAIFSYGLRKADDALAAAGVPLRTLTGLRDLLRAAEETGYVPPSQRDALFAAIRAALGDLSEA